MNCFRWLLDSNFASTARLHAKLASEQAKSARLEAAIADNQRRSPPGRVVQVDPIKPTLKASETKRLKLGSEEPRSKVAFKF
jgi:hypothetical protein